ncbi:DUF6236 family protein [Nocardia sp. NPDC052316]|uniref:DUF6236 family protein n=1 Tax=Nocardia sp. NPDC052316 TaxID=3364329 RepID=UPI0037C602C0
MKFRDENWLKIAMLTWDRLAVMRWNQPEHSDSNFVKRVRSESDFLLDVQPDQQELCEVGDYFRRVFDEHCDEMVSNYSLASAGPYAAVTPFSTGVGAPTPSQNLLDRDLVWVLALTGVGKMEKDLRSMLCEGRFARVSEEYYPDRIGLHPKLGRIYLTALADVMARNSLMTPATDDPAMHAAAGTVDRLTDLLIDSPTIPRLDEVESAYVHLALRTVIEPRNLDNVPVDKLISFRARYGAELAAFRDHVSELSEQLAEISAVQNLTVAHAHIQSTYESTTKRQLIELRRALRGLGIESTVGTMSLKVDINVATGTMLGGLLAAGGQYVIGGAAVAASIIPYLARQINTRKDMKTNSPVSYLLAADRTINGNALLERLPPARFQRTLDP